MRIGVHEAEDLERLTISPGSNSQEAWHVRSNPSSRNTSVWNSIHFNSCARSDNSINLTCIALQRIRSALNSFSLIVYRILMFSKPPCLLRLLKSRSNSPMYLYKVTLSAPVQPIPCPGQETQKPRNIPQRKTNSG